MVTLNEDELTGSPTTPGFPDSPSGPELPWVPFGPANPKAPGLPRAPDCPGPPGRPSFPGIPWKYEMAQLDAFYALTLIYLFHHGVCFWIAFPFVSTNFKIQGLYGSSFSNNLMNY